MKTDLKGCSTTENGSESYEYFSSGLSRKRVRRVQYDYRTHNGQLFSCVAKSLDIARQRRDRWLEKRNL